MKERQMFIKKATKITPKEFSWCEIRWKMKDHGKSLNSIQKTGVVADFQIPNKPHLSLLTAISEDASLREEFFANDSLGG
jgi:hypothetical protein